MLTLFVASYNAQVLPQAKVTERLPDGSYIVVIDNTEYRAITADQAREIQTRKVELTACNKDLDLANKEVSNLKNTIELAKRDATIASQQVKIAELETEKYKTLFDKEHELRLEGQKLIGKGRVTSFFDNPIVQIGTKIGVPLLQMAISKR